MDGDALDVELLIAAATREIENLKEDSRLSQPTRGSRGSGLRDHVLDLIQAVEKRKAQAPASSASQRARSAFARNLRQGIAMLGGAHAALPWLDATRQPSINLGSLYLIEEWAQFLVGDAIDLVVVPDPEFMYSTVSSPFASVILKTPGFTPKSTQTPVVLNYPLSDADRLLLHPIFAHELGHAAVQRHSLVASVTDELDGIGTFIIAFEETVAAMAAADGSTRTQISGALREHLHDWVEELLCDHLAIEAAGPAFLWAFALFALPLGYGTPGREHPPNTLRLRLALDHLEHRGWRPHMDNAAPGVTRWLDAVASDAAGSLSPGFAFLRDQLTANAGLIRETAMQLAGLDSLNPGDAEQSSNEAADLLHRIILPVGLHDPLEPRSILLGGWQEAIRKHGDNPRGLVEAASDSQLQALIGKAIEMSTVASAWEAT